MIPYRLFHLHRSTKLRAGTPRRFFLRDARPHQIVNTFIETKLNNQQIERALKEVRLTGRPRLSTCGAQDRSNGKASLLDIPTGQMISRLPALTSEM